MIDRHSFIAEQMLRSKIRKILKQRLSEDKDFYNRMVQEHKFRNSVKKMLTEKKGNPAPHRNTGINVLTSAIKKIIPIIRDDFKTLTTDPEQRKSFRAHLIKGVKNSLAPIQSIASAGLDEPVGDGDGDAPESNDLVLPQNGGAELNPQDINERDAGDVDVDVDATQPPELDSAATDKEEPENPDDEDKPEDEPQSPEDKVIDVDNTFSGPEEEEEENEFDISNEDATGRNMAVATLNKIEKNIIDEYSLLDNQNDREMFYNYLIINLKLYFNRWEEDLSDMGTNDQPAG